MNPRAGEVAELEAERARLRHAERLGRVTRGAADALYDKDALYATSWRGSAGELASDARARSGARASFGRGRSRAQRAGRSGAWLGRYAEGIEADPGRLTDDRGAALRTGQAHPTARRRLEWRLAARTRLASGNRRAGGRSRSARGRACSSGCDLVARRPRWRTSSRWLARRPRYNWAK